MLTLDFLFLGIALGLSAGLSPGPLQAIVISETLLKGKKEGIKVALAPLLTDLPHPYMFWLSVGAPLVDRTRNLFETKRYFYLIKFLGAMLIFMGLFLIKKYFL